jgi:hypothetical protein
MKATGLLGPLVIGCGVVVAALAFALVGEVLREADGTEAEVALQRLERQVAAGEDRLDKLERDVERLRQDLDDLRERPAAAAAPVVPTPPLPKLPTDQFGGAAPLPDTEGLVEQSRVFREHFNKGIIRPTPAVLRELLGEPRASYSQDCQSVTNPALLAALETRQVGSFKLTMLRPALESFERVMERLRQDEPEIYAAIGTAGALCVRHVRGRPGSVSSHAWGAAVDLTLARNLDQMGDEATQFGLVTIAEYFNDAGWYWGAGYDREDSMHFEVGEALLRQWKSGGQM